MVGSSSPSTPRTQRPEDLGLGVEDDGVLFQKTERQREALDVLNGHRHGMLYGGARSGKTVICVRNAFLRALKRSSNHLIVRYRYNHARISIGHETIPWVLSKCFPGLKAQHNKSDGYWTVPADDGGESRVWLGGTDDQDRVEKILGNEYSTIYLNECSQIPFDAVLMLHTRLAENSGLQQRAYYDCNPPGKSHWTHKLFVDQTYPDGTPHKLDVAHIQVNPGHNRENLSPEYLAALESLPKRQRQRFLDGQYLSDIEGALWTDQMIVKARLLEPTDLRKTVIAVDPSVTHNPGSDECGIVPCGIDFDNLGVVLGDLSGKMTTNRWARRVVNAYHAFDANEVVAEVNNGGDLVEDAIHNIDPYIKVVKVRASTGKRARAEPVSMLYERNQVAHAKDMPELEAELTETNLDEVKSSPNRLDAAVWGLTHLMVGKTRKRIHIG